MGWMAGDRQQRPTRGPRVTQVIMPLKPNNKQDIILTAYG